MHLKSAIRNCPQLTLYEGREPDYGRDYLKNSKRTEYNQNISQFASTSLPEAPHQRHGNPRSVKVKRQDQLNGRNLPQMDEVNWEWAENGRDLSRNTDRIDFSHKPL